MQTTVSVVRARPGGYVGDGLVHPAVVDAAREGAAAAKAAGAVIDAYVARCGAGIALILTHRGKGAAAAASRIFDQAAEVAVGLGQHGAGKGSLALAEMSFTERPSEPLLCFLTSGAGPDAWRLPLYRMFADPLSTPSLVSDPEMSAGFRFVVGQESYDLPGELHALVAALADARGASVSQVIARASRQSAAAASSGPDPVLVVRCHDGLPSVGEALEAFALPAAAPLMPVASNDDASTRMGSPARVVGLGFQVCDGRLIGPRDLFGDRAFDSVRRRALEAGEHRLSWPSAPAAARALSRNGRRAASSSR